MAGTEPIKQKRKSALARAVSRSGQVLKQRASDKMKAKVKRAMANAKARR